MARTKASVGAKGSSERGSKSYSGGNPVCPRDTPNWQKPITNFFISKECNTSDSDDRAAAEKPKSRPKRNVIESDEEYSPEKPKNKVLDESIDLEPLTGDNSHKIEEYYASNDEVKNDGPQDGVMVENINNVESIEENNNNAVKTKGKGVGKKSKGKENVGSSLKREREEEYASESINKRIKAD